MDVYVFVIILVVVMFKILLWAFLYARRYRQRTIVRTWRVRNAVSEVRVLPPSSGDRDAIVSREYPVALSDNAVVPFGSRTNTVAVSVKKPPSYDQVMGGQYLTK